MKTDKKEKITGERKKSVKFKKLGTPKSEFKKYVATPHSSTAAKRKLEDQSPRLSEPNNKLIKKRKLSFGDGSLETTSSTKKKRRTLKHAGTNDRRKDKETTKQHELEKRENTIFIGNLPSTTKKKEVIKLFSKYGTIVSVRIRCAVLDPKAKTRKAGVILKQFEDKSSFNAYIRFSALDECSAALKANGELIGANHIRVDLADGSKHTLDKKKAVYLSNISYTASEDYLWNLFSPCGEIESVRLMRDKRTYQPRGKAFINFTSRSAVELALKLDGTDIEGRQLKVLRYMEHNDEKGSRRIKEKMMKTKKKGPKKVRLESKKPDSGGNFAGAKSEIKNKKRKKLSVDLKKKKKIAEILRAT